MPRGGWSSNPEARKRQEEGLARGRQNAARKVLGQEGKGSANSESSATGEGPSRSKPSTAPASKTRKAKPGSYGKPKPKTRKKAGSGKPKRQTKKPPEPTLEPKPERRGGFVEGLRAGLGL